MNKNRLIEMKSSITLMEREVETLRKINMISYNIKLEASINYIEHQLAFMRACIQSELNTS
jgi:hypothetical protein